jgi:hypothetical protein
MTNAQNTTDAATDYVAQYNSLLESRKAAETDTTIGAGARAGLTRRLNLALLEATLEGATDLEVFAPESQSAFTLTTLSDQDLRDALTTARENRVSADGAGKKAAATQVVRRLTNECQRRNLSGIDYAWSPPRPGIMPRMSREDAEARLAKLEVLIASGTHPAPLVKIANRERDLMRSLLGIDTDTDAPADDSSPIDTGKLLDAVTDAVAADVEAAASTSPRKRTAKVA